MSFYFYFLRYFGSQGDNPHRHGNLAEAEARLASKSELFKTQKGHVKVLSHFTKVQ